jgi:hypothetical protein
MVVLLPPEWAPSAPAPGSVFDARVGATLQVTMIAMDRNSGDAIQIEFGQNCHASKLPPLPLAQVSLGPNVPAPGPPPFPNPVTRVMSFSPLPVHSNMSFCACFVAKSAGADSPIRCIVVRVREFVARFIEDAGVGAVLPSVYPASFSNSPASTGVLGNITGSAAQVLQGQIVNWTVGVFVAGASGFTLSPSRATYLPDFGYLEAPSSALNDLKTSFWDQPAHNSSAHADSDSSGMSALTVAWSVRRGQPGMPIICFVLSIPLVYGPLYQQEGCEFTVLLFESSLTIPCRCYAFLVIPCTVVAVEGDSLHSIGHSHGVSYTGMLLVNTHLQARPNHIVPGDVVATALIHRVDLSCSVSVLADAMLVTLQQLRCVFLLCERGIVFINFHHHHHM